MVMWKKLSALEQLVMDYVWVHSGCTADDCRQSLAEASRELKYSTVRTLLHRLEQKGYVEHDLDGRVYRYRARARRRNMAASAAKQIADRLCAGSVEELLVGMVENQFISPEELKELSRRIARRKGETK